MELIDGDGHKLPDFGLSASSSLSGNSGPDRSRMSVTASGELAGAWIAGYNDVNQYIQVLAFSACLSQYADYISSVMIFLILL